MPISGINLNKILAKINKSLEPKGAAEAEQVAELIIKLDEAKAKIEKLETDVALKKDKIKISEDLIKTKEDKKNVE